MRVLNTIVCTALAGFILGATPMMARAEDAKAIHFVVKDVRNVGEGSVRFGAAQGTQNYPNIALLGANKEVYQKVRSAVQKSEDAGFPVRAIMVGPSDAAPALEIYAKGMDVTNAIDPYKITEAELIKLIRDIHKKFYGR